MARQDWLPISFIFLIAILHSGCEATLESWGDEERIILVSGVGTNMEILREYPQGCGWPNSLSIALTPNEIWLKSSVGSQWWVPKRQGMHDWSAVREIVEEYTESPVNEISSIEVAAVDDTRYQDLMALLQVLEPGPFRQLTYVHTSQLSRRIDFYPPARLIDGIEIRVDQVQGLYDDGQRVGHWIERFADQKVGEGDYVAGARHGHWRYWWQGKKVAEGDYDRGTPTGTWSLWGYATQQGYVERRDYYDRIWMLSEGIKNSGEVRGGQRHGRWVSWDLDDDVIAEISYTNGVESGLYRRWSNGRKIEQCRYIDGKRDGAHIEWHENGQIARTCNYVDGEPTGTCRSWHER